MELYEVILKDVFKSSGVDREFQKEKLRQEIEEVDARLSNFVFFTSLLFSETIFVIPINPLFCEGATRQ